ncbi:MAG: outer membrane beta-barrel domain-containing protein [Ectothiorhodospiraceae bacterium]|nr:outer membrane beta-barrel domain-containing protein [Ectothiorhodospiraceae bacterium]
MEGRLRILFLGKLLLGAVMFLTVGLVWSAEDAVESKKVDGQEQVIQPEITRRTIDIDKIDTEDFEIGVFGGILSVEDFGANAVVGVRAAYHISESIFVEAAYAKTDTTETSSERLIRSGAPLFTDTQRELTYYNISLGYNVLLGEAYVGRDWAFNTALYFIGGVGNTNFLGLGGDAFTVNFGVGYRFLVTDWLAVHIDVRDHIIKNDFFGSDDTTHNLEIGGGLSVFF